MTINLQDISESLHIQPVSADIYIELLTHGELTLKMLKKMLVLTKKQINDGLEELLQKRYILMVENAKKEKVYQALSMLQLEERIEREQETVKRLKKFIIPQIQPPEKLGILKYEGFEGIRRVYIEILEEAIKTHQTIYAIENKLSNSEIGEIFLNNYFIKRIRNKVKAYVICPYNLEDKKYKEECEGEFTEVKLIKKLEVDANINIVGDLVMVFSPNPPQGTLRRNDAEAITWKSIFMKLWNKIP